MKRILLIFLLIPILSLAMDGQHLARIAIETHQQNKVIQFAWTDLQSDLRFDITDITRANGVKLMNTPKIAYSYDNKPRNVSHFYTAKNPRLNMIVHYAGRIPGEVLSLGLDNGFSAKKININPALFMGYSRAFKLAKNTHIAFNANAWLGGKVSEQPCIDGENREYYCATLTAWSDYKPIDTPTNFGLNIAFKHNF